jgi:hypothetical protein
VDNGHSILLERILKNFKEFSQEFRIAMHATLVSLVSVQSASDAGRV